MSGFDSHRALSGEHDSYGKYMLAAGKDRHFFERSQDMNKICANCGYEKTKHQTYGLYCPVYKGNGVLAGYSSSHQYSDKQKETTVSVPASLIDKVLELVDECDSIDVDGVDSKTYIFRRATDTVRAELEKLDIKK